MLAVVGHQFGGIDNLQLEHTAKPKLESGAVRIGIRAAGVSFANLLFISGKHQNRPSLPFVPGTEIAGFVTEIAEDVKSDLRLGDRVCASLASGGFAEEAVVDTVNVFRIPDCMAFETATLFPTIYATAYGGLIWRAGIQSGDTLLVHGAAGASGLAAVDIGKAVGATVIATAGGDEKAAMLRSYGAHHVIDYSNTNFKDEVLRITGGRGVDIVFDPVGGNIFEQSLRCAAPLARLISMGFASGHIPQIPANLLLVKNLTIIGLYWGFYMARGKSKADPQLRHQVRQMFTEMFDRFRRRELDPKVGRILPLDQFAEALKLIQERRAIGKVVLTPGASS